ncbi:hypothetical protein [Winogradskyella ludwigii]|uniref:hypothetical protein n=1 Tax=Winogradskyella ludwigii TaxID=2686076 RepID=UPI0015CA7209|nr:hypothetical protein [Winogradskyella ludwigii]
MGRNIEFPKIVDLMNDMKEKEEYEALLPLNVVSVNEFRKDIERNNKKAKLINIAMLLIALFSFSYAIYKDFNDVESAKKLEKLKLKTLYLEQNIENYQKQLHEIKNEINILRIDKNDSLK